MVHASLAATVMFQMRAELDASRQLTPTWDVLEREKSTTLTEPHANNADHTLELRDKTQFAFQTPVLPAKLLPG